MQPRGKKVVSIKEDVDTGKVVFNVPAWPAAQVQKVAPQRTSDAPAFKDFYTSDVKSFAQVINDPFLKKAADYIKRNEGVKSRLYKDSKGFWTIGIGHLVTPNEMSYYRGRTLSQEEIYDLFAKDMQKKLSLVKKHFPKYNSYSDELKIAILDGYFRGDLAHSDKTRALLNAGKFKAAAKEYLNHDEYRAALASGSGVAPRMQRNARIFAAQS